MFEALRGLGRDNAQNEYYLTDVLSAARSQGEKVRALGAVLEDVGSTPITRIDVRAPGAPVVVAE